MDDKKRQRTLSGEESGYETSQPPDTRDKLTQQMHNQTEKATENQTPKNITNYGGPRKQADSQVLITGNSIVQGHLIPTKPTVDEQDIPKEATILGQDIPPSLRYSYKIYRKNQRVRNKLYRQNQHHWDKI
ncbi:hypothetical protein DPMN_041053 [Dreissena polymorpha]|uniref:Uncharacterized protein n=1 Tax=Dreissena polymorpha TaxID=45954 RepID=A0A9D4CYR4_DREPO|nr:hypothetical protein DPMN_041053 [Dreissena polymorpha]